MKNDQEFLDGMWAKVDLMEDEIKEKEKVALKTKKALINDLIIGLIFILISAILFVFNLYSGGMTVYLISFLVILAAYIIEEFSYIQLRD